MSSPVRLNEMFILASRQEQMNNLGNCPALRTLILDMSALSVISPGQVLRTLPELSR